MIVKVILLNTKDEKIDGVVQLGTQAVVTVEGEAVFNSMEEGTYVVRGLSHGFHLEAKILELSGQELTITLKAR